VRNAYLRAIDILSNEDEIDLNMLVLPGVYHEYVTDYAIDMVEDRADCFYPMAISGNTKTDAINYLQNRGLDTSYAGVYYPHVLIEDTDNNKRIFVEPTTIMPYVYGMNDSLGQPYYAPAGFNRTALNGVVLGVKEILNKQDRDDLYRVRINPVAKFHNDYVIWGQKTLQIKETALTRINVRRLLIYVKKAIASYCKYLVFEQNAFATWQKFENGVRPILQGVMDNYGIKKFKIMMNDQTVTPENIERNEMPGIVKIYPVRSAEFIPIDFVLTEEGAQFEE
jgi:phage tail sheath protein FI